VLPPNASRRSALMAEEGATPDRVEIVLRVYDAWNRRDVDEWLSFLSPDIVFLPASTFTDSHERQGLDAMRRFMDEWSDAWADDFISQAESIREYGDVVIALIRFKGHSSSGIEVAGGMFEVVPISRGQDRADRRLHRPRRGAQSSGA
jgi:ketosteroid isomerase-like protein